MESRETTTTTPPTPNSQKASQMSSLTRLKSMSSCWSPQWFKWRLMFIPHGSQTPPVLPSVSICTTRKNFAWPPQYASELPGKQATNDTCQPLTNQRPLLKTIRKDSSKLPKSRKFLRKGSLIGNFTTRGPPSQPVQFGTRWTGVMELCAMRTTNAWVAAAAALFHSPTSVVFHNWVTIVRVGTKLDSTRWLWPPNQCILLQFTKGPPKDGIREIITITWKDSEIYPYPPFLQKVQVRRAEVPLLPQCKVQLVLKNPQNL